MKKILVILALLTMTFTLTGCEEDNKIHHAEIIVKDKGTIKLELDGGAAPITVNNFIKLANEGFYNGLTFHRVVRDFVIQGGDPLGNGTGGSEEKIKGEFKINGVNNNIEHRRGVISMARSGSIPETEMTLNSASSQFFIVVKDNMESLDGKYAAFGHVTEGMEVVDDIVETTTIADLDSGYVSKENQPIIEKIVIID